MSDPQTEVAGEPNAWITAPADAHGAASHSSDPQAPLLEEELRPDRIRQRSTGDRHTVVIDAGFSVATVRVVRTQHPDSDTTYKFLQSGHSLGQSGWNYLPYDGTVELGVIAAGDRWPKPGGENGTLYAELGEQIREHLVGLVDAVATKGTAPARERPPSLRSQWPAITADPIRRDRSL